MIDKELLWDEWLNRKYEKRLRSKSENPVHNYKHFSEPFKTKDEIIALKSEFLDVQKVSCHNFSPLLAFLKKTPVFSHVDGFRRIKWKIRPLMYADHPDAWLYSWYSFLLSSQYETLLRGNDLDSVVSAYRQDDTKSARTNASIAKELFDFISSRPNGEPWDVLLFDIEKFYDTLHPRLLKQAWCKTLGCRNLPDDHYAIYKSIMDYGVVRKGRLQKFLNDLLGPIGKQRRKSRSKICTSKEFHLIRTNSGIIEHKGSFLNSISRYFDDENPNRFFEMVDKVAIKSPFYRGVPQGLPISPTLANIYMFEFDRLIQAEVKGIGGIFRRYADDIAIVCPSDKSDWIKKLIVDTICNPEIAGLNIQQKKTEHFRCINGVATSMKTGDLKTGITYLGLTYLKGKGYVKSGTIAKGHQRIRRILHVNFGRKKAGKKHYSEDRLKQKILGAGIFKYISMCKRYHGEHVRSQYSKRKIGLLLDKALAKYAKIQG